MSEVRPTAGKTFLTAGRRKVTGAGIYYSPSAKRLFLLLWTWGSRGPAAFLWLPLSGWTWCTPGSVPPRISGLGNRDHNIQPLSDDRRKPGSTRAFVAEESGQTGWRSQGRGTRTQRWSRQPLRPAVLRAVSPPTFLQAEDTRQQTPSSPQPAEVGPVTCHHES